MLMMIYVAAGIVIGFCVIGAIAKTLDIIYASNQVSDLVSRVYQLEAEVKRLQK